MNEDRETIRVTLTVTLRTEDGSHIGDLDCDLERDLVDSIDQEIERGLLTTGHDELVVDEYRVEAETVEE